MPAAACQPTNSASSWSGAGAALFSSPQRAALAWTEALTLLSEGVSDDVYVEVSAEFSEKELAYLTSAIVSLNV